MLRGQRVPCCGNGFIVAVLGVLACCTQPGLAWNYLSCGAKSFNDTALRGHSIRQSGSPLMCSSLVSFNQQHPDVNVSWVPATMLNVGLGRNEQLFALLSDMLSRRDTTLEVLELDAQWTIPLSDSLERLDGVDYSKLRKKYLGFDLEGRLLTVPHAGNQMVIFFRKDIFARHGLAYPHGTMAEFETVMLDLQTKERAYRKAQGDPHADDFYSFAMPASESPNRITYLLITLLSGTDGGGIVEANGKVSINNPAAIATLAMWRRWYGLIAPPAAQAMSTANVMNDLFAQNKAAAVLLWANDTYKMYELMQNHGGAANFDVGAGPIPGPNGAGCLGMWSWGLSKHTRQMDAAKSLLAFGAAEALNRSRMQWYGDYLSNEMREDPELWRWWCGKNPILCESHEAYPDFWERVVERPAAACGPVYEKCASIVHDGVWKVFRQELSPEQAAAHMEKELQVLLGHIPPSTLDDERETWTAYRIAMVVVACSGAAFLAALFAVVWRQLRAVRRPSGCSVPLSVLLGVIMASVLTAVLGTVIDGNDNSFRDLSTDMAISVRQQSLLTVERSLVGTLEALIPGNLDMLTIKHHTVAKMAYDIRQMQVHPRSLVVLIERESPQRVLLSSDTRVQPNGILPDPLLPGPSLSPMLYEALIALQDGWRTGAFDEQRTLHLHVDGKVVQGNVKGVRTQHYFESHRRVDWLVIYLTPDEVILRDAEDALQESLDKSILMGVVAVVVTVLCAVAITFPLVRLAVNMERVRVMDMENVTHGGGGVLMELGALSLGFTHMCNMLAEYKTFIPKTLFAESSDSDKDLDTEVSCASHGGSLPQSAGQLDTTAIIQQNSARKGMVDLKLSTGRGSVAIINLLGHLKRAPVDDQSRFFSSALSAIEAATDVTRTTMHSLSTTSPCEVVLSCGLVQRCGNAAVEMGRAMLLIQKAMGPDLVTFAAKGGKFIFGNLGTLKTRGFGILTPGFDVLQRLRSVSLLMLEVMGEGCILCHDDLFDEMKGVFRLVSVDVIRSEQGFHIARHLMGEERLAEAEWMYQVATLAEAQNDPYTTMLSKICQDRGTSADQHIADFLDTDFSQERQPQTKILSAAIQLLRPVRQLKKSLTGDFTSLLSLCHGLKWITQNTGDTPC